MLQLLPGNKVLYKQETKVQIIGIINDYHCIIVCELIHVDTVYLPILLHSLVLSLYPILLLLNVCAPSVYLCSEHHDIAIVLTNKQCTITADSSNQRNQSNRSGAQELKHSLKHTTGLMFTPVHISIVFL